MRGDVAKGTKKFIMNVLVIWQRSILQCQRHCLKVQISSLILQVY